VLEGSYRVTLAPNGEAALEVLSKAPVDAAVVDLMMQVLAGAGFVRALEARGVAIPVILASASTGLEATAVALGACDWLAKPFDAATLEEKLARALR
jgi:CheY-like chemotaxis protein